MYNTPMNPGANTSLHASPSRPNFFRMMGTSRANAARSQLSRVVLVFTAVAYCVDNASYAPRSRTGYGA
jgi:hypothetical protein